MKTFPIGKVWGGIRGYQPWDIENITRAFNDFTDTPADPKAAIILTFQNGGGIVVPTMTYFYDGPTPPKGAFKQFEELNATIDWTRTQTYLEFVGVLSCELVSSIY
jgi:hypothetical protein